MNHHSVAAVQRLTDGCTRILDVGGAAHPYPDAHDVIDALPYGLHEMCGPEYGALRTATWTVHDLCTAPWPYPDKSFDFAVCSHVLEDVRDPLTVCREMIRVAKAGFIQCPSRIVEQSLGVEHPLYAGYYHHRWLVTIAGSNIAFRLKPHSLHTDRLSLVTRIAPWSTLNPIYENVELIWQDGFTFQECFEFSEEAVLGELRQFAAAARELPSLSVRREGSFKTHLLRTVYCARLWLNARRSCAKRPSDK